jgi:hypothetical protein
MRLTHASRDVEVKLTPEELLACGKELSAAMAEVDQAESDLEYAKSRAKATGKAVAARVGVLRRKIDTGFETRKMDCAIIYRWEAKEKDYIRPDTLEVCHTDIIEERDLQEEAKLEEKREAKEAAAAVGASQPGGSAPGTIGEALEAQGLSPEALKESLAAAGGPGPSGVFSADGSVVEEDTTPAAETPSSEPEEGNGEVLGV